VEGKEQDLIEGKSSWKTREGVGRRGGLGLQREREASKRY